MPTIAGSSTRTSTKHLPTRVIASCRKITNAHGTRHGSREAIRYSDRLLPTQRLMSYAECTCFISVHASEIRPFKSHLLPSNSAQSEQRRRHFLLLGQCFGDTSKVPSIGPGLHVSSRSIKARKLVSRDSDVVFVPESLKVRPAD
jgi:hypothetical protein